MIMNTKICLTCRNELSTEQFTKNRIRTDGLNGCCKGCKREHQRRWYQSHKKEQLGRVYKNRKVRMESIRRQVTKILLIGCKDCGNDDIEVLEFDHVIGKKFANVSSLIHSCSS